MVLFLIIILISVHNGVAGRSILQTTLVLLQKNSFKLNENCVIALQVENKQSILDDQTWANPTIVLREQTSSEVFSNLIHRESHCAIGIIDNLKNLETMISVVERAKFNIVIYWNKLTHLESLKNNLNFTKNIHRQVLEIHSSQSRRSYGLSLFCPNQTQEQVLSDVNIWMENSDNFLIASDLMELCPHPISGKTLNAGTFCFVPGVFCKSYNGTRHVTAGTEKELMDMLMKKYKFNINYIYTRKRFDRNFSAESITEGIHSGRLHFGVGIPSIEEIYLKYVDASTYLYYAALIYVARLPQPLGSHNNVIRPFTTSVWITLICTIGGLAFAMFIIYKLYQYTGVKRDSLGHLDSNTDLFIRCFFSFTEPDPLPYFVKISAGKIVVCCWYFLALFINLFYASNLRSHMIAPIYEKPVRTTRDMLDRNLHVYASARSRKIQNYNKPGAFKLTPDQYELAEKIHENGWRFNKVQYGPTKSRKHVPDHIVKEIFTKGALMITEYRNHLTAFVHSDKRLAMNNTYIVEEYIDLWFIGFHMKKYSPWSESISDQLGWIRDMGIERYSLNRYIPHSAFVRRKSATREKIKLDALETPFLIYGCLISSAFLALIGETIRFYYLK